MLLTEYNEVETMELFKAEGRTEGYLQALLALARKGLLSVADAAAQAGMTESAFKECLQSEQYLPGTGNV